MRLTCVLVNKADDADVDIDVVDVDDVTEY